MLAFDPRRPDFLACGPATSELFPEALPRRIGKFRILGLIGEGGMGAVFEAEQDHPHRTVALKILRAHVPGPRLLRRFEQEGELLGRLEQRAAGRRMFQF
jgi:serine/threonine protein kinase